MILPIITITDDKDHFLSKKCEPVKRLNKYLVQFGKDLEETLKAAAGLGLAAPQVGKLIRVIVVKLTSNKYQVMYNPVIISQSPTRRGMKERCLSFPDFEAEIKRPTWIKVRFLDANGKTKMMNLEGLDAVVTSHECDHLQGKTIGST